MPKWKIITNFYRNFIRTKGFNTTDGESKTQDCLSTCKWLFSATNLIMEIYSLGRWHLRRLKKRDVKRKFFRCKHWRGDSYARNKDDFSGCVLTRRVHKTRQKSLLLHGVAQHPLNVFSIVISWLILMKNFWCFPHLRKWNRHEANFRCRSIVHGLKRAWSNFKAILKKPAKRRLFAGMVIEPSYGGSHSECKLIS